MNIDKAKQILSYLISKNLGFCFLPNGQLISREYCEAIIKSFNAWNK